jgi:hypothetical protein
MATTEKIIIEIDVQSNTLKDTEDKIKKVSGALVKLRGDEKANENQLRATEAELRLLNKTYREQDRVLQASIKANNAAEGSLEQLKAQYVVAQAALNKMSAEQRENTQEGKDQMAEVARLNAELKRIESSYGQNARNVGNYTEAVKPLRQQLRELTMQLQQLEMQGQGNSEEFRNLSAEAGRIKDTMGDVNNTIKALASDTSLIDGVATGISGVAGAFSAAQGAAALFGDENEDLQKTMVKIQATMAIANGVQQVANALQKDSAAMVALNTARTQAATAAQAIYTAVVGGTTGVLKALRIALAATGIGLAIVAIGFLIAKIVEWTESTNDQAKSEAALKMQMEANIKVYEDTKRQIELVNDQKALANKINIDLAKSSGATAKAIAELENKSYEDQIKGLNDLKFATAVSYAQLTGYRAEFVNKLVDNNDLLIKELGYGSTYVKTLGKDNAEQAQKYLTEIIGINNQITTAQSNFAKDNNEKLLKAQEEFKKKTLDALSALNTLENRIFSDNIEYKLNQLAEGYEKEQLIIDNAYSLGLIKEAKYNADKLALTNDYFAKVKDLISQQFNSEQAVRDTQLVAIDTFNQQVTDSILKRDEDLKKQTDARIAYDIQAATEFLAKQEEEKDKLIAIYVQASDAINLAFTNSLTAAGIDLKKFQKQFISIIIDTIEKTLLLRYAEVILSSTAQLGPIAGPIAGAAAIGSIKALFAIAKSVVAQFEDGGIIPKAADGMLVGNRHAQGGIKIGTPSGMIEAEGGEVIINRKSVSMYKPLLSAINEAGGGVKFADGGQIYTPPVSQEFNILADMFKTMPQPVVSVVDIIDVTQKVGRVKATATL